MIKKVEKNTRDIQTRKSTLKYGSENRPWPRGLRRHLRLKFVLKTIMKHYHNRLKFK